MKMIAKTAMRYATRSLKAGDAFEAGPTEAKVLVAIGKAVPAAVKAEPVKVKVEPVAVEPIDDEKPARKRKSQD
jgi:hypothetical protein